LPPCLPGMALTTSSPPVATPTTPTIGLAENRISPLKWTAPSRTGKTLVILSLFPLPKPIVSAFGA
jgi:hypothetical protein